MTGPRAASVDPLGFVILSHDKPYQTVRLTRRLARDFPEARIVCHHDFSRSPLDPTELPASVELVRPHRRTQWGNFSLVEATLSGVRRLFDAPVAPEWFVLLSGADYPLQPADQIRDRFVQGGHDAHLANVLVDPAGPREQQMDYPQRFLSVALWWGQFSRRSRPTWRQIKLRNRFTDRLLPFHDGLRCHAGSQWFAANRRAAERLLDAHRAEPTLRRHYRWRFGADESYPHTILCNARDLSVKNEWTHLVEFVDDGPVETPRTFTRADLDRLLTAGRPFARKFDERVDADVLDALDRETG